MQKRKCFLLFALLIILALTICLMVTACGESGNNDNNNNPGGVTDTEKPGGDGQTPGDGNTDYDDGVTPTEGLEYELSDDGTYYIVTGIGNATATELVIGGTYNGLPVKSISANAFENCKTIKNLTILYTVINIGDYAFGACESLTEVIINNGLTIIDECGFYDCENLKKIILPKSLEQICDSAFRECNSLQEIYYEGNEEEWWMYVEIGSGNSWIRSATYYYYSETQPAEEGNYWHYVNGVVTKW